MLFFWQLINLISEFWFENVTVLMVREQSFPLSTWHYRDVKPTKKNMTTLLCFYSSKVLLGNAEKVKKICINFSLFSSYYSYIITNLILQWASISLDVSALYRWCGRILHPAGMPTRLELFEQGEKVLWETNRKNDSHDSHPDSAHKSKPVFWGAQFGPPCSLTHLQIL